MHFKLGNQIILNPQIIPAVIFLVDTQMGVELSATFTITSHGVMLR